MSISDQTEVSQPAKRKKLVRLSEAQWIAARFQYESGQLTVPQLMAKYDVSERTIYAKLMAQKWQKGTQIANGVETKLQEIVEAKLDPIGNEIANRIGKKFEQDIAPWLEREKRKHIKDSLKRVRKRQRVVDDLLDEIPNLTARDAAYIAKSDDTYDNMARRNLGMNDETSFNGSLSVNILTRQAAVQVTQP